MLVSHVMPAWNPRRDWFEVAVAGVLAEVDVPVELVVVDDGSDAGLVVPDDPRVRVLRTDHAGVARARDVGLEVARGDFVRFVDADDEVVRGSTRLLLDLRGGSDSPRLVTYGGIDFCDDSLRRVWTLGRDHEGDMQSLVLRGRMEAYLPCLLIPADTARAVGAFDPDLLPCEDLDWIFRLAEGSTARGTATVVYRYRRHASSTSAAPSGDDAWRDAYDRHYARHPEHRGAREERWLEAAWLMGEVRSHARRRDLRAAAGAFARALRLSPDDARYHALAIAREYRQRRA